MTKAKSASIVCVNSKPATKSGAADPIFAAIEAQRAAEKSYSDLARSLDRAESKAFKTLGHRRPSELVAWRGYHGDANTMKETRARALALPNASPKGIAIEYRAALASLRKQVAAGLKWDRRAGVVALRRNMDAAIAAEHKIGLRMARTKPRTIAGALALLNHTMADLAAGHVDWHSIALASVAAALGELTRKYEVGISRKALGAIRRAGKGGAK